MVMFFFCLVPLTELYSFWYGLKDLSTSAQVSEQKLMTPQVEEAMWIRTCGYGRLLGKWVKGKKKRYLV